MDNCKPVWREAGQMQSQALDTETNLTKDNQAMRLTQDSPTASCEHLYSTDPYLTW